MRAKTLYRGALRDYPHFGFRGMQKRNTNILCSLMRGSGDASAVMNIQHPNIQHPNIQSAVCSV